MSTSKAASAKRTIDRILARFHDPATPELAQFVSGVNDAGDKGSIDDGTYGDPLKDTTTPDFIKKDKAGWDSLVTLKR
jgi:hypothetical protein